MISARYFIRRLKYSVGIRSKPRLYFVAPQTNWILDWVAYYVVRQVSSMGLCAKKVASPEKLVGQIIHFGSLWDIQAWIQQPVMQDNLVVGTIFHGERGDAAFESALAAVVDRQTLFAKLLTASSIMEKRFVQWGIAPDKIVNIPLGVDLQKFRPFSVAERLMARQRLGIPENAFVVGSFHKDGVGTKEGLEPKLIKGPDVLLDTISKLKDKVPVFVYLTAPARGYVINGLRKLGVPFRHDVFENYYDVAQSYAVLDAYLVASREEGGPSGVLEAQAAGVPLVSTRVGLAPDLVQHGYNGLLSSIEDSQDLADQLLALAQDRNMGLHLAANALNTIQAYDWPRIARRYYEEIYQPILGDLGY